MEISGFNPLDMVSDRVQRETRKPIDWCCLLYIGGAGGGGFFLLHQYFHSNTTCADLHMDQTLKRHQSIMAVWPNQYQCQVHVQARTGQSLVEFHEMSPVSASQNRRRKLCSGETCAAYATCAPLVFAHRSVTFLCF